LPGDGRTFFFSLGYMYWGSGSVAQSRLVEI
jgi:hypothetical protein